MTDLEEPPDDIPAFPAMLPGGNYCTPGMTLRDWFAGQALSGWLAGAGDIDMDSGTQRIAAIDCYRMADAMLKAREGKP